MSFRKTLWTIVALGAAAIHAATAVIRLDAFLPLQAFDFSSYYTAAWSIRLHISPYTSSPDLLKFLSTTQGLSAAPPTCASPPLWPWLLQPLTAFSFPSAAAIWIALLLAMTLCCHILLVREAGYRNWKITLLTLPLTLTFGPLFLNLTLGQNAIVLLLCALLMGEFLKKRELFFRIIWIPSWLLAIAAKIFPVLWICCFAFLKNRRTVAVGAGLCIAVFAGTALWQPEASSDYWQHYIVGRATQYSRGGGDIDDQSLKSYVDRVTGPTRFEIPALKTQDRRKFNWNLPWNFSRFAHWIAASISILIGVVLLYCWIRSKNLYPKAELFSLILFTLIFFPNMQRYNHVLALPAMAWLWNRGRRGNELAIAAYALFAFSRLNHLWATLLPSLAAAAVSGLGLFAILLLLTGLNIEMLKARASPLSSECPAVLESKL